MFQFKGLALPPPNGAQMTRRMALTQSSISFWEFAMSRKDSWLMGARSFSPVPPAGTHKERKKKRTSEYNRDEIGLCRGIRLVVCSVMLLDGFYFWLFVCFFVFIGNCLIN